MKKLLRRFLQDKSGVTAVEYALIGALVGIAIIGGARLSGRVDQDIADNAVACLERG